MAHHWLLPVNRCHITRSQYTVKTNRSCLCCHKQIKSERSASHQKNLREPQRPTNSKPTKIEQGTHPEALLNRAPRVCFAHVPPPYDGIARSRLVWRARHFGFRQAVGLSIHCWCLWVAVLWLLNPRPSENVWEGGQRLQGQIGRTSGTVWWWVVFVVNSGGEAPAVVYAIDSPSLYLPFGGGFFSCLCGLVPCICAIFSVN